MFATFITMLREGRSFSHSSHQIGLSLPDRASMLGADSALEYCDCPWGKYHHRNTLPAG